MANKFEITISAIDRASATVRKVNKEFGKTFRPLTRIKSSAAALGREIGIPTLGKNLAKVGKAAQTAASKLSIVAAPLTAIIGGGTIAGVVDLATAWGHLGMETAQTAQTLGVSIGFLQSTRGAASALGIDAGAATGSIKSLGDTMQDAFYGRNQMALAMLGQLGIRIHRTKDGAVDTTRAFMDMSRAISHIKSAQVQGLVARTFGMEAMLPLLRQGPEAIKAYQKRVEALGGVMSNSAVQSANKFALSLNYLKIAGQSVRNAIGDKLMPILSPLVDKLTNWLGANRELIATRVTQFVQGFATWLQQVDFTKVLNGITDFIQGIGKVVDFIGGWKNAVIGVAAVMAGPMVLSVLQVVGAVGKLVVGLSPVLRIVGVLTAEFLALKAASSWFFEKIGTLTSSGALSQNSWLASMNSWMAGGPNNQAFQLHMSPKAMAYQQQQAAARAAQGGNSPAAPVTTVYTPGASPAASSRHDVHVNVEFKNAPPGTVATTRTGGKGPAPVRVAHAMAGA